MVSDDEFKLIEKRFEAWNEKVGVASIVLGDFTKGEILSHIKAKDNVGKEFAEIQLNYIRRLKER